MDFITNHPVLVVSLVKIALLLFIVLTALAYLTWFERKLIAHIQSRWGPTEVGAHGLLQPLADGVKFLFKEDLTPPGADKFLYILAPFLALALGLTTIALIPFGPPGKTWMGVPIFVVSNTGIGLMFVFAITSIGVYGVALAGWSSNSKYPLMGGLRSSAQMISYEVALTLSVVGVVLLANTLNFNTMIEGQRGYYLHFIPRWNIVPQIIGFLCYFTSAVAETNRVPFDLPEAESELVAGFHTEYSGFRWSLFFLAEYSAMLGVSSIAVTLWLGGWLRPFANTLSGPAWDLAFSLIPGLAFLVMGAGTLLGTIRMPKIVQMRAQMIGLGVFGALLALIGLFLLLPGVRERVQDIFWFVAKVACFMYLYIWYRGTFPRYRFDQLMKVGWKVLLPIGLGVLIATALVGVRQELWAAIVGVMQ